MGADVLMPHRRAMTTLHISHTIRDVDAWLRTFNSFADVRDEGGVTAASVHHGVDDPNLVTVDLTFDTVEQARSFLERLRAEIWPASPYLDGVPTASILEALGAAV
jgi:hypothetical protein